MKTEQKIIMRDSDEAAQLKTVTGWVSSHGQYYGKDEALARYAGCTHDLCACGNQKQKHYILCETCRRKKSREHYLSLPFEDYNGQTVYSETLDKYFFSSDDIEEALEELDGEVTDLELYICEPQYLSEINFDDLWQDVLPEDWSIDEVASKVLIEAMEAINNAVRANKPASWAPGKKRTTYIPNKDTHA